MTQSVPGQPVVMHRHTSAEDVGRANFYALAARLFAAAADQSLLSAIASAPPLESEDAGLPLTRSWSALIAACSVMDPAAAAEEYDALFGGVGRAAINLHASHHIAGAMMDRPLVALRHHLAELGLARLDSQSMPEDHLSALCEVMRILIVGTDSVAPQALSVQRRFFRAQIEPWFERVLSQICEYPVANFYRVVAQWAYDFLQLEREALSMD
ncbi:MAG: molecular chaperone [Casimicrobiaceae bacterium]